MVDSDHRTVTVALTTANSERWLAQQLADLDAQTAPPDQVVVVDDASSDTTPEILERWKESTHLDVQVVTRTERGGVHATQADALALVHCDLVALCDHDDRWHPEKLAHLTECFNRGGVSLAASDATVIDERGRPVAKSLWQLRGLDERRRDALRGARPLGTLLSRSLITGCTAMFDAALLARSLPLPPALNSSAHQMFPDRWLSLVAAGNGRVQLLERPLTNYRRHAAQLTGPGSATARWTWNGPDAASIRASLAAEIDQLDALSDVVGSDSVMVVNERIAHLRQRQGLHDRRRFRLPGVARIGTAAYRRHQEGVRSALADAVRPAGPGPGDK